MKKKIFKNTMLIVLLVVLLCGVSVLGILYNYYNKELSDRMIYETEYISNGVESNGLDYLNTLEKTETRITWVDENGIVLFDNKADKDEMDNHKEREEIKEALTSSAGSSSRYSNTISAKTMYHAKRLEDGTVIRLAHTQSSVFRIMLGILSPIAAIIVLALILSAFLTMRLTKQFVEPLENIDLDYPEKTKVYDELSPFIRKIKKQNIQINKTIEEQKSQQKEFRLITENMQEGFIVIDKEARILSYNSSVLRLFRIDMDVSGKNVLLLNRTEEFSRGVVRGLKGEHHEDILPVGERYYNIYINPAFSEGKVAGAVIIVTDVTETEEREKLRREFAANVSHELKTPLTSISGTAEIIKNGIVATEDISKFAGNIYFEAQRLISLVEDIIKLSQLDEGKSDIAKEKIDLYSISVDVAKQLSELAGKKHITINVDGETAVIEGVRPVVTEMIYNLCDNAVKYNNSFGNVNITVGKNHKGIFVTVEDNGIGVPKDQQERIFERFYRVDKSHSKEIGGTGLGLSIVKHGARLHNAGIDIESETGKGTVITINFPL